MRILRKFQQEREDLREVYAIARDLEDTTVMKLAEKQGVKLNEKIKHLEALMHTPIKCTCKICQEKLTLGDLQNEVLEVAKNKHIQK